MALLEVFPPPVLVTRKSDPSILERYSVQTMTVYLSFLFNFNRDVFLSVRYQIESYTYKHSDTQPELLEILEELKKSS